MPALLPWRGFARDDSPPPIRRMAPAGADGRTGMLARAIGALAVVAGLWTVTGVVQAYDDAKYPNLRGQWYRSVGVQWDPSKPGGRGQQPLLTAEYQAIWETSLAEQRKGGQ